MRVIFGGELRLHCMLVQTTCHHSEIFGPKIYGSCSATHSDIENVMCSECNCSRSCCVQHIY